MKVRIGLETHCQLNTQSKMFCPCRNPVNIEKEPEPNSIVCETCLGFPGTRPRVNRAVVDMAIKTSLALGCKVAPETYFSRKTYFYPDLSKNFQTTQYEAPLGEKGTLTVNSKKIRITRVHMEEDPAKLVHIGGLGGKHVLVDYNRSGIPLLEIVTEPDISSPREAREFLQKLETILEYLGVYDSTSRAVFKSDANISMEGGQRVEVKNITGTREIEQALKFEMVRQANLVTKGVKVERETRMWDPNTKSTGSLRTKEGEAEYGYITEPDLTAIELPGKVVGRIRKVLPELPDQRYSRLVKAYSLSGKTVESLVSELELVELFEWLAGKIPAKVAASWVSGPLKKTLNWHNLKFKQSGLKREWVLSLLRMFVDGRITDLNAEMAIRKMVEEKVPAEDIVTKYKLLKTGLDLDKVIGLVLGKNPRAVEDYKKGEEKALHFLVGQVMKETGGRAGAEETRKALLKFL